MAQAGYFSCIGCGRLFKEKDFYEVLEYKLHDCDADEDAKCDEPLS